MTIYRFLSGPAECDFVEHGNVIVNNGGLADDHAGCVIDQNAFSDACGRMNVDGEDLGDAILQIARQRLAVLYPEPVTHPIRLERVESFVVKKRLRDSSRCGVAPDNSFEVVADRLLDLFRLIGVASLLARWNERASSSRR
jgi:hypothetical protein